MFNVATSQLRPQFSSLTSDFQSFYLTKQTTLLEHLVCEHKTRPYRRAARAVTFSSAMIDLTKVELVPSRRNIHTKRHR